MFDIQKKIKTFLSSIMFPSSETIARIERMSPEEIKQTLPNKPTSPYPFISSLFNYRNDAVRELVSHTKYKGNSILIDSFGELLQEKLYLKFKDLPPKEARVHIIPVPLSKERLIERGFNQSELLCRSITKHDREKLFIHSPRLLKRTKNTPPQTKLGKIARLKNVKDCFSIPEKEKKNVKGKTIVLVDDVTTTGSTLKEARLTLLKAGANEVFAITLAH